MTTWLTPVQIAGLPGLPRSVFGVRKKAQSEGWQKRIRESGRGDKGFEHPIECLPVEARLHLASRQASVTPTTPINTLSVAHAQEAGKQIKAARQVLVRDAGTALTANVTGSRAAERDAKALVLVCLQRFWSTMGGPLCPAIQAFCEAWNLGLIEANPAVRERFPKFTSWNVVKKWHQALKHHGGAGITRPPAPNAGKYEVLTGDLGQRVIALLHDYPHLGPVQLRRLLATEAEALPSDRAFQRALSYWKRENAQLFSAVTNPDQWRSHYMSAAGSRSEQVQGVNDLWETDGTKGEVMLADGKRWTITAIIDVYTRRMIVRLSASPRAAVVMGLMRQAIATWGTPAILKSDNGSDYVAGQFELSLVQLGVEHRLCDPFQPQQKPHIERAIGTMLHDLFELLPGYLGHNVAQRTDIEARRSFAERLMRGSGEGGPVELRLQPDQLQLIIDNWLSQYHERDHGGLGAKSPNEVLAAWPGTVHTVDERALDIFLAPASADGLRTVGKKGIKLDHGWFNCAEIGGLEGQQVQVKQTEADLGTCYVFDLAGRYIGTAFDHARLGVSAAEVAAERRQHQQKVIARQKAEMKAAVKAVNPQQLVMNVLQRKADAAVDASPNVTRLRPTAAHESEGIRSVIDAPVQGNQISAGAAATLKRLEEGQAMQPVQLLDLRNKPSHRYSHALRLQARMANGEAIDPRDLKWLDGYVTGSEFKGHDRVHQGQDPLAAEGGG